VTAKKKVVVAMSGGVDSSLAAALLVEQGYEVIGITMQIWPSDQVDEKAGGCCSLSAVEDARRVACQLGIPFYVLNFRSQFEEKVINYFCDEYLGGRTPNPCIACNRYIKFELLLDRAMGLGADYIATGHYASIKYDEEKERYLLIKAKDKSKDQTYALFNLTQDQLSHTIFPLGGYEKTETRKLAGERGLRVATKPDSQEICFVQDDYESFLRERIPDVVEPGPFLDTAGNRIGTHKGIPFYTIGQRKGLGLALGKPAYVVDIDVKNNAVIIGNDDEVYGSGLIARDLNFIPFARLEKPLRVKAKIRYSAPEAEAEISLIRDDAVKVLFEKPQRAITPGQAVVFYDGNIVVGGGTIECRI
jgi:tRNA-specific 2-thiouridylase